MICKVSDLVRDVRVALDRNGVSDSLILEGDIDTLSVDEIIRSKILEAVRRVHCEAPAYLLEQGHSLRNAVHMNSDGSGYVLLPDDFMRLIMFGMSDWERIVYSAISTDDTNYELQSSRFKGIRGNPQKPICAIAVRPEGRVLEFYSCKSSNAYVKYGTYLPYPIIDSNDGIDICERCRSGIIYIAAALTCITLGEGDKSNLFVELSKSTLQ